MPLRDFACLECGMKQERYTTSEREQPRCICGGALKLLERSQEGEGHTTHVRVK